MAAVRNTILIIYSSLAVREACKRILFELYGIIGRRYDGYGKCTRVEYELPAISGIGKIILSDATYLIGAVNGIIALDEDPSVIDAIAINTRICRANTNAEKAIIATTNSSCKRYDFPSGIDDIIIHSGLDKDVMRNLLDTLVGYLKPAEVTEQPADIICITPVKSISVDFAARKLIIEF